MRNSKGTERVAAVHRCPASAAGGGDEPAEGTAACEQNSEMIALRAVAVSLSLGYSKARAMCCAILGLLGVR